MIKLKEKYTIIIVTHNINQAKKISDNAIFMYNGKIIESGKTEDIFSNPKNQVTKNYISN